MKTGILAFVLVLAVNFPMLVQAEVRVLMSTSEGDIHLSLDDQKAPISVKNFLRYVEEGFYNDSLFHRVIDGFMIQGGGFDAAMNKKATHENIINEASNGLKNERGTIAMARMMDANTASSQFFINQVDNGFLNPHSRSAGYAVFGKVVQGMEIVDKIAKVQTSTQKGHENVPVRPVLIKSVSIVETMPVKK